MADLNKLAWHEVQLLKQFCLVISQLSKFECTACMTKMRFAVRYEVNLQSECCEMISSTLQDFRDYVRDRGVLIPVTIPQDLTILTGTASFVLLIHYALASNRRTSETVLVTP